MRDHAPTQLMYDRAKRTARRNERIAIVCVFLTTALLMHPLIHWLSR